MKDEGGGMKKRKLLRLKEFDYSSEGAYFVTIATHQRQHLFGRISGAEFVASAFGNIAQEKWSQIPAHFPHVSLDAFIVMPNHVHGIIVIEQSHLAVGAQHAAPLRRDRPSVKPGSLGAIVRSYKSAVTRAINKGRATPGPTVWQRNYYEHIIRDYPDLEQIRHYILNNALTWDKDPENPT
jgi:REP element-mobilizing transposase RayT